MFNNMSKKEILANARANEEVKDNTRMIGNARSESLRYASGSTTMLDRQRSQMANILNRAKNKRKKGMQ